MELPAPTSTAPEAEREVNPLATSISAVREQSKRTPPIAPRISNSHLVTALLHRRKTLASHLLCTPSMTSSLLPRDSPPPATSASAPAAAPSTPSLQSLISSATRAHVQNAHRLLAAATLFEARDPDPAAVDGGRVLGVRVEAYERAGRKFGAPGYVFLNRVEEASGGDDESQADGEEQSRWGGAAWRVHRHTFPPCIPVARLAERWLPQPRRKTGDGESGGEGGRRQDLGRFVRELRRDVAAYQRRKEAVERLGKEFSGQVAKADAMDAEIRDVRIVWKDGRSGRVMVGDGGSVEKAVVTGERGDRDRMTERRILAQGRMERLDLGDDA